MQVNYDKLWKILEERKMMKTELIRAARKKQKDGIFLKTQKILIR